MKEIFAGSGIFSVIVGIAWWLIRLLRDKPEVALEAAEDAVEIVKAVQPKPKPKTKRRKP